MPFHWFDRSQEKKVQVTFAEYGWEFSGSIDPTLVDTTALRLRNTDPEQVCGWVVLMTPPRTRTCAVRSWFALDRFVRCRPSAPP